MRQRQCRGPKTPVNSQAIDCGNTLWNCPMTKNLNYLFRPLRIVDMKFMTASWRIHVRPFGKGTAVWWTIHYIIHGAVFHPSTKRFPLWMRTMILSDFFIVCWCLWPAVVVSVFLGSFSRRGTTLKRKFLLSQQLSNRPRQPQWMAGSATNWVTGLCPHCQDTGSNSV